MELGQYFSADEDTVVFSEEQASAFAKGVAGDFNPIHDPDSKRFCVPGDLLFCVLLSRYGVAQTTAVEFSGMLDAKSRMRLPSAVEGSAHIQDANSKELLKLFLTGDRIKNPAFVSSISKAYVSFSGQTFPDILVPLMRSAQVMINPARPLVIYKDMSIELIPSQIAQLPDEYSGSDLTLTLSDKTDISVNGRKGAVRLCFDICLSETRIGTGEKNMVLSGLREFKEESMQQIVDQYNSWRAAYG